MATVFSETLTRLRAEAGFPTAYRYFHDNGGAKFFNVSYRNYLMMEQGRNLPAPARLPRLILGLRLPQGTPAARELVKAWLRAMAGDEVYADLLEPMFAAAAAAPDSSPAEQALQRSLLDRKYHMSEEQLLATLSSYETYKCAFTLENDAGVWTAEALSKGLGISKAQAAGALKGFLKAGLVTASGKGGYKSKFAGQLIEYPSTAALRPDVRERMRDYLGRLEREGVSVFGNIGMFRADENALRGYFPMLKAAVDASHAYSTARKTGKSAAFFVSARVRKLWDF